MSRKIKIFKSQSEFIPSEPCFLPEEINYARKLASVRDPEEQKIFWETVLHKKESDPTYLVYQDFPLCITNELPSADSRSTSAEQGTGSLYDRVGEIIADLKEKGVLR